MIPSQATNLDLDFEFVIPAWMLALAAAVIDGDSHLEPYEAVLEAVVGAVPGVDGAALCSTKSRKPVTLAVHGDAADSLITAQRRAGQGPTLHTLKDQTTTATDDLSIDSRWPQLHKFVSRLPVRSVLCRPLRHAHPRPVALTLYARQTSALGRLDVDLLDLVLATADVALAGIAQHARVRHLDRALQTNERISVAVGILMTLNNYSEDEAMAAMAVASQAENRKVNDIAADVVLTGAVPTTPRLPTNEIVSPPTTPTREHPQRTSTASVMPQ